MSLSQEVHASLRDTALHFGVSKLAELMHKAKGTLYNKLEYGKPEGAKPLQHHKPTLEDFIEILHYSHDLAPLRALNAAFGLVTYQIPDMSNVSDAALLDLLTKVNSEGGITHHDIGAALADGIVTQDEFRTVDKDVNNWIGAIVEMRDRFGSLVQVPQTC